MLHIFEGPSGSGKTTYIQGIFLQKKPDAIFYTRQYGKGTEPHDPNFRLGVFRALCDLSKDRDIVIDRMHFSEAYFGKVLRGYNFDWQEFEQWLRDNHVEVLLHFMRTPWGVCHQRYVQRGGREVMNFSAAEEYGFMQECWALSELPKVAI